LGSQAVARQQGAVTLLEQITIAEVVDCGGKSIGAVRLGNSSQFPEGVLKSLAEALETLGKADRAGLPVGVSQNEVIDEVVEWFAGKRDVQLVHRGEVGSAQFAGGMRLIEEHLLGWSLGSPPCLDLALQGTRLSVGELARETPLKILKKRLGLETRRELQPITQFGPDILERILPGPPGPWRE